MTGLYHQTCTASLRVHAPAATLAAAASVAALAVAALSHQDQLWARLVSSWCVWCAGAVPRARVQCAVLGEHGICTSTVLGEVLPEWRIALGLMGKKRK